MPLPVPQQSRQHTPFQFPQSGGGQQNMMLQMMMQKFLQQQENQRFQKREARLSKNDLQTQQLKQLADQMTHLLKLKELDQKNTELGITAQEAQTKVGTAGTGADAPQAARRAAGGARELDIVAEQEGRKEAELVGGVAGLKERIAALEAGLGQQGHAIIRPQSVRFQKVGDPHGSTIEDILGEEPQVLTPMVDVPAGGPGMDLDQPTVEEVIPVQAPQGGGPTSATIRRDVQAPTQQPQRPEVLAVAVDDSPREQAIAAARQDYRTTTAMVRQQRAIRFQEHDRKTKRIQADRALAMDDKAFKQWDRWDRGINSKRSALDRRAGRVFNEIDGIDQALRDLTLFGKSKSSKEYKDLEHARGRKEAEYNNLYKDYYTNQATALKSYNDKALPQAQIHPDELDWPTPEEQLLFDTNPALPGTVKPPSSQSLETPRDRAMQDYEKRDKGGTPLQSTGGGGQTRSETITGSSPAISGPAAGGSPGELQFSPASESDPVEMFKEILGRPGDFGIEESADPKQQQAALRQALTIIGATGNHGQAGAQKVLLWMEQQAAARKKGQ